MNVVIVLFIIAIVLIVINIIIMSMLIKDKMVINVFSLHAVEFVNAFNEVRRVINVNSEIYRAWGLTLQEHSNEIERHDMLLDVYGQALQLSKPNKEKISAPESNFSALDNAPDL